ncbi:hypothetical protein LPJ61_002648 [Coemansia biformis]|uniref:C3H1-type domain-containing protein n=1 Tax=Coemansia biformis TaxID=1286918 RepID=A0A9W8CYG5_9FUNG|nr:hypothetical protein LPJ61_002648 [Coemansia biformis]
MHQVSWHAALCALRETLDLTGLGVADLVADEAFRAELRYVDGIRAKQVIYFLARLAASARQGVRCDGAGIRLQWCTLEQALERGVFQSMQNILARAEEYIEDMRDSIPTSSAPRSRTQNQHWQGSADGSSTAEAGAADDPECMQRPPRTDAARLGERFQRMDIGSGEQQRGTYDRQPQRRDDGATPGYQRRPQDNLRYKTKLCEKFERDGECPYYHKCVFAHGRDELRARPESGADYGGHEHPAALLGQRSVQTADGLRQSANVLYKTRLCQRFSEQGECPYGDRCQFAHGDNELRTTPESPRSPRDAQLSPRTLPSLGTGAATRAGVESAQARRRNAPDTNRVLAPQMSRNISWSNTGARAAGEPHGASNSRAADALDCSASMAHSPAAAGVEAEPKALYASPLAPPLATPTAQRIPAASKSRGGNGGGGGAAGGVGAKSSGGTGQRAQSEPRGASIKGGEKPWIKVVEVTDKDLKEMGGPRADDAAAQKSRPADLETRLAGELAETFVRCGQKPGWQVLFKELTRVEFRNSLTKQQLLNIAVSALFAPCGATDVADAIARNAELLHKLVGKQQDQLLLLNAWHRLLVEDANAALWQRKAPELLGSLYSESLLDEDIFNAWFAKRTSGDCGPEILAMKPFAHWLATAEEE